MPHDEIPGEDGSTEPRPVEMSPAEVDSFVGVGGSGVLALARDDTPYAIPVSYGYEPGEERFFLRLGQADDSEKPNFVRSSAAARLVIYADRPTEARSVVAKGPLDELPREQLTPDLVETLSHAQLPRFELWTQPRADVGFTIYTLDVRELTGRKAVGEDGS